MQPSQVTFNLLFFVYKFVSLAAYCPLHKKIIIMRFFYINIFCSNSIC
jgi:hypothetical protein